MTTWTEVGGHPAPGQPDQIRNVANHFGELSVAARLARTQLAALQRGELRACWTGVAADAFASELEILPADLGKLETSLDHASTAVHRWASRVEYSKDRAEREFRQYGNAEQQLRNARYERDREREALINEGLIDPVAVIGDVLSGNNRLAPYERRVDDAYDQVRRIQDHIDQIREEVEATARTVANLLDEASRLGIQNNNFFQNVGEFFAALGEALKAVLKFLDELVDLIAPWVGMALLILSFINPAFALVAVGFAALDFGLTASRALLGDEDVTLSDLLDDGVDLALALVGAKGANAGLGVVDDFGRAANEGSKLVRAADTALNVVGGAKVVGDYYLNLGGMIGVGPGSVYDLFVDVSSGDTSGWAPGEGPAYGSDFGQAAGELGDALGNLGEATLGLGEAAGDLLGGDSSVGLLDLATGDGFGGLSGGGDMGGGVPGGGDMGGGVPGGGDMGGGVPGGGDMGGGVPGVGDMGGGVPGGGDMGGGVPGGGDMGGGVPGGDFGGSGFGDAGGLVADGSLAATDIGAGTAASRAATDIGAGMAASSGPPDVSGLVPDLGGAVESPKFEVLTPGEAPASGLVPDSAPVAAESNSAATPLVADASPALIGDTTGGSGGASGAVTFGAAAAAVVGLGGASVGAKRITDRHKEQEPEPGEAAMANPVAAKQALIGTSEFVLSEIVESPVVEVARVDDEGTDDE